MTTGSDIISVLGFPAFANQKSNPYNARLYAAAEQHGIHTTEFSFARALAGKYDIIHIHWPEKFLNSHYRSKALIGSAILLTCLYRQRITGRQVVWTVHNLIPHETKYPAISRWFWKHFLRNVTATISLSHINREILQSSLRLPNASHHTEIHHPLYPATASPPQQLIHPPKQYALFFGRIMPYKNVERLAEIFIKLPPGNLGLVIAGNCESPEYCQKIKKMADRSNNITLIERHISDSELDSLINNCTLGILPFKNIFNSGSLLQFPSHGRPVIAPFSKNFAEYSRLFPKPPLIMYEGELSKNIITKALANLPEVDSTPPSKLTFEYAGRATANFFREILGKQSFD